LPLSPRRPSAARSSAVAIWAAEQAALRARFQRPFEAVTGSLNETVRSLELFAETAVSAGRDIARARVVDFERVVDEKVAGLRRATLATRENSASLESPELMIDNLRLLDEAVAAVKGLAGLANASISEVSARVDDSRRSLEDAAEGALELAARLSGSAAVRLADMSTGHYGLANQTVDARALAADATDAAGGGADFKAAKPPQGAGAKRAVARGLAALANGALGVLEAVVPGERPELTPASKRKRLGNLLGFDWKLPGAAPGAADDDDDDGGQRELGGALEGAVVDVEVIALGGRTVPGVVVDVVATALEPEAPAEP
jgi:hypothetical protein